MTNLVASLAASFAYHFQGIYELALIILNALKYTEIKY